MEKSIAVVVTFNRLHLLKECIKALRNQTTKPDAILVVNNGSTDDTGNWLQSQNDILVISQNNTGSGGGFETGISWGYKNGYTWIWCMDDDGRPKEDALEKILAPQLDSLCLRNCAVINIEDKKSFVWKTKHYQTVEEANGAIIEGVGHPFNGTLIHRNIVERVGVPRQSLFMWGDETEYYHRITSKNKIPVCTVSGSIHYHPAAAFSFKKDWDYRNAWKMYYYVRNRLHINRTRFNYQLLAWANYCCFLMAMVGVILLFQKTDKVKKINFLLWPVTDALKNDFSANPTLILSRLSGKETIIKSITGFNLRSNIISFTSFFTPLRFRRVAG